MVGQGAFRCSFCGKEQENVAGLIASSISKSCICDSCVVLCDKIRKDRMSQGSPVDLAALSPADIYNKLSQYVVGQECAKKVASVAAYNHIKKISLSQSDDEIDMEKSNLLIFGPTGTGKTLIASVLAKILMVPIVTVDATTYTEAGYVGEDVENAIYRLYQQAKNNKKLTELGIICIDEVDKISRKAEGGLGARDVSGEGVQHGLLKLLEGSLVSVPPASSRRNDRQEVVQIDTKRILFVCCGAFAGLEDVILARTKGSAIGFRANMKYKQDKRSIDLLIDTTPEDLIKYGLIPEFVSRLPILTPMHPLTESMLVQILSEPKNALVKQYKKLFSIDNVELEFTDDALKAIAHWAIKRKGGARGLRAILEELLVDYMFEIPGNKNIKKVVITEEIVRNRYKALQQVVDAAVANYSPVVVNEDGSAGVESDAAKIANNT